MTGPMLENLIDAVAEASRLCRTIQIELLGADTRTKSDRSPVTIADYAAQAMVCFRFHRQFPQIPIVAEERSDYLRRPEGRSMVDRILAFLPGFSSDALFEAIDLGGGEPRGMFLTVDPIDGTKGFLRGGQFAVATAVIDAGRPILGVLGCPNLAPALNQDPGVLCYSDAEGRAWMRSMATAQTHVLTCGENTGESPLRFLESVESGHAAHDLQARIMTRMDPGHRSVRLDSQAKYAALAMGQADIYLRLPKPGPSPYVEKIWDHAAGAHLIECAGGQVTDVYGRALDFSHGRRLTQNRGVVASTGAVHSRLIATLADVLPECPP